MAKVITSSITKVTSPIHQELAPDPHMSGDVSIDGSLSVDGVPIAGLLTLTTTDGVAKSTPSVALENDSTYLFDLAVVARNASTDTESKAWSVRFAVRRGAGAGTTALVGSVSKTVIGQDTGTTAWDITATADLVNGRPNIVVTGQTGKTVKWDINVRVVKASG